MYYEDQIEYYTVRWRENDEHGVMRKFDETFRTRVERDTFMATLPSRERFLEVTRYCDLEVLFTFPEGDQSIPFEFSVSQGDQNVQLIFQTL